MPPQAQPSGPGNRHERRKQAALDRGREHRNRVWQAKWKAQQQSRAEADARAAKQDKKRREKDLKTRAEKAPGMGIAQPSLERRASRYKDKN